MNDPGAEIEPQQLMPFAANEEQIARGIKIERTRSVQGSSTNGRTVRSGARLAGSSKGGDDSRLRINPAQDVIANIGNVEVARWTKLYADGLVQPGLIGRSIIARVPLLTVAGERREQAALGIITTNHVIAGVANEEVASGIKAQFMRFVQRGILGRTMVAGIGRGAVADHRSDDSVRCDPPNNMGFVVGEPEASVRSAHHAEGTVQASH